VSGAVRVVALAVAEIVTVVEALTAVVEMLNEAPVFPASTVTLAGTVATPVLLLESVTAAPPGGAALDKMTAPCEVEPPTTGESTTRFDTVGPAEPGGVTVIVAVLVVPL